MALHNRVDKKLLKKRLMEEPFKRITFSFYRYVILEDPSSLRDTLFQEWSELNAFGRIYLAQEGINAQMSVPEHNYELFLKKLYAHPEFNNVPIKIAVEDDGKSFYKLIIKIRHKIVNDGLDDNAFDVTNVGKHLTAEEFNQAMENPDTLVIDMRNHYECEVGHFQNAFLPNAATFRDALPEVINQFEDKKDKKILLYCTGGIRCEKASAYLKHYGFKDVNQLHGGIIQYAQELRLNNIDNKYVGKNFVFDERLGERISNDIISNCHQCGKPCDTHTNCENQECHILFIQCEECRQKYEGCCSPECQQVVQLPVEVQKEKRKKKRSADEVYLSKQKEVLKQKFTNYKG